MSKNTGNFLTLAESIERFSADGMRLSLAVIFFIRLLMILKNNFL